MISTYKEENEMTYQIKIEEMKQILEKILSKYKVFKFENCIFNLEKGKKHIEIHFLCSNGFEATREHDGVRKRIKYDLIKKNWSYTEKSFIKSKRFEETKVFSPDMLKNYATELPYFDAIMLKYSIKYDYVDFLKNKKFRISLDCCYALSLNDEPTFSPAFCYIEFENKNGVDIKKIINTGFFEYLCPHFYNMEFKSHNRIQMCQTFFKPTKVPSQDILLYATKIENIISKKALDIFQQYDYLHLRGEKNKERGSHIESELKLYNVAEPYHLLDKIRLLLDSSLKLVKTAPRVITDIYFDNNNFVLLKNNASFRIRKRKKMDGWISCFKSENSSNIILNREKTQTELENSEILSYDIGMLKGDAAHKAIEFISNMNENIFLKPKLLIVEYRDRYVIRIHESSKTLDVEEHYNMKRGELIHIIFDDVYVYDIANASKEELEHLLCYGELDFTKRTYKYVNKKTVEIEPNLREDVQKLSARLFKQISENIGSIGDNLYLSKYALGMREIDKK